MSLKLVAPEVPPHKREYRLVVTGAELDMVLAALTVFKTLRLTIRFSPMFKGVREIATNVGEHAFPWVDEIDGLMDWLHECDEICAEDAEKGS